MPIRVKVAGKGIVEFPDGTTEDVMRKALSTLTVPGASPLEAKSRMNESETPTDAPLSPLAGEGPLTRGVRQGFSSFIKGLKELPGDSAAQGMAHPQTLGDVANLLIPSELGMGRGGMSTIKEAAGRYGSALKTAGQDTKSLRDVMTLPVRAYRELKDALPSSNTKAVEDFFGGARGTAPVEKPAILNTAPDVIDRARATAVAEKPVPRLAGKAPTLQDELQKAVEESMTPEAAKATTAAPTVETAGAGPFKQSWPKTKQQNLGGYSSGRPPAAEGKAIEVGQELPPQQHGPKIEGMPSADPDITITPGETSPTLHHGQYESPFAEDVVAPTTLDEAVAPKPKLSAEELAAELRRHYGSRDGGKMLFPNKPASFGAGALKRLAPGPSRTPLVAEERIRNAMNKAKGDDDPILKLLVAGLSGKMLTSSLNQQD